MEQIHAHIISKMIETLIAIWLHGGKSTQNIYQGDDGMFVRDNNGDDTPFLMEFLYDSFTDKIYLTCEWLTSSRRKQKKAGGSIHIFPINNGIFMGDTFTIERNGQIKSVYDWNSPTIVRKIEFKTTPDWLNTEYLRKKREHSN
jgi:hypothetical protein